MNIGIKILAVSVSLFLIILTALVIAEQDGWYRHSYDVHLGVIKNIREYNDTDCFLTLTPSWKGGSRGFHVDNYAEWKYQLLYYNLTNQTVEIWIEEWWKGDLYLGTTNFDLKIIITDINEIGG